jgi:hypothetical protein
MRNKQSGQCSAKKWGLSMGHRLPSLIAGSRERIAQCGMRNADREMWIEGLGVSVGVFVSMYDILKSVKTKPHKHMNSLETEYMKLQILRHLNA